MVGVCARTLRGTEPQVVSMSWLIAIQQASEWMFVGIAGAVVVGACNAAHNPARGSCTVNCADRDATQGCWWTFAAWDYSGSRARRATSVSFESLVRGVGCIACP